MKLENNISTYIICLILLLIGFGLGIAVISYDKLNFNTELSLGDISDIILTLFVTLYIPFFLNRKINNKRTEKDMVIQSCTNFELELSGLRSKLEDAYLTPNKIDKTKADRLILNIRHLSKMLSLLEKSVETYKKDATINKILKDLSDNQSSCWENITINLRDRIRKITPDRYLESVNQLYEYSGNISQLKMQINNF